MPEALRLAADLAEQKAALEAKVEADKPKVAFAEAVRNTKDTCLIEEFAKTIGTGRNRFFQWLREQRILQINNLPYQRFIDMGWFKVEESVWEDRQGQKHVTFTTRITGKGQVAIESRYRRGSSPGLALVYGGAS